jgi:penicillin-binding protein 1C
MPCQPAKKYRAMSPEAAFIVSDILSDNSARSEVFGRSSPLQQSFWAAVKTGTSRDMRDNWCIGFSSEYTVGVWVGNFNNEPMRDVSGVTGAAPLWANLMNWLHENRATKPWSQPIPPPDVQWVSDGTNNGEFFLSNALPINSSGSQPTTTAGRILYPKANALLATDPGIPVDTQKVMFRLEGGQQGRLYLDGTFHADADEGVLWSPVPGRHVLSLIGKEGKVLDRVAFSVRE